ncbi:MFS transporter [Haloechinothrix halophila]|uniref:MFS transporter n=1 Tax=Haloechinothrix halophila TaxID=1069073 RepID=UPI00041B6F42|nr:MFS transporter [Haloechinothrix halophila]
MTFFSLSPALRLRIGVGFVNRFADSMITTFMAIYLALEYSVALAGVLMVAVVSLGVVGMLIGGHVADSRGRRVTLLAGESAVVVTFVVMVFGESSLLASPLVVYLAYVVNKFAASLALPAHDSLIVDITTPEIRKQVYTVNFWAVNLALATGAMLGAVLYDGRFVLMLVIAAVGSAGVVVSTWLWIAETKPETVRTEAAKPPMREFVSGYRQVLRDRTFIQLMVAGTLTLAVEFQLINYVGVRLAADLPEQDLLSLGTWSVRVDGPEMLGVLRAENTILVVIMALFAPVLLRKVSDRIGLYLGTGLFIGGYMVLAVSNTGWLLMVAGFVFTVGELMSVPIKQTLLANLVPDHSRTRYMAVHNLNIRLAQLIAALCITVGSVLPSWGMAGLYAVFGLIIVWQYRLVLRTVTTAGIVNPAPADISADAAEPTREPTEAR